MKNHRTIASISALLVVIVALGAFAAPPASAQNIDCSTGGGVNYNQGTPTGGSHSGCIGLNCSGGGSEPLFVYWYHCA